MDAIPTDTTLRVYLCGPITGLKDEDCKAWRDDISVLLDKAGYEIINPMRRDYRPMTKTVDIANGVVKADLIDLTISNIMIRMFGPSEGSAQETFYFANTLRRPVILIAPPEVHPWNQSPWLWSHCYEWVRTIEDAVEAIPNVYSTYMRNRR
jgi:hypothetical protein